MPGPVSDSYDPEFGTSHNVQQIKDALDDVYKTLTYVLDGQPPIYILDLVQADNLNNTIQARLTEKQWRLLRFCVERAGDSL